MVAPGSRNSRRETDLQSCSIGKCSFFASRSSKSAEILSREKREKS